MSKENQLENIAKNIKLFMESHNPPITKQQLADKSQISYPSLTPILHGTRDFGLTKLINIAEALNVSPNDLLKKACAEPSSIQQGQKSKVELLVVLISFNDITYCYFIEIKTGRIRYVTANFVITCGAHSTEILANIKNVIKRNCEANAEHIAIFCSVQEYEFKEQRNRLIERGKRNFPIFTVRPDWEVSYFANFKNKCGICIVINDGLSIIYKKNSGCNITKLQGLGFPIADEAGNLWLGWQAIRFAIKVKEGLKERSKLSDKILSVFSFDLHELSEQVSNHPNRTYQQIAEIVKNLYFQGNQDAVEIIKIGSEKILDYIISIDKKTQAELPIYITGDTAHLYKQYIPRNRLITSDDKQEEIMRDYGINILKNSLNTLK